MLVDFCMAMRDEKVPVSTKEFLVLLEGLAKGVIGTRIDELYTLARCTLVKDESLFDRFDRAFAKFVLRAKARTSPAHADSPAALHAFVEQAVGEQWRRRHGLVSWNALLDMLREGLHVQGEVEGGGLSAATDTPAVPRHPSAPGTAGTGTGGLASWDARHFREYDGSVQLGTRNLKVALRRLRRFAHEGAEECFDLEATIRATAHNAGWLDIRHVKRRTEKAKVLLLMDVGGSMDEHVTRVEELFSAARSEFKRLEFFYFHNCVYEQVWRHHARDGVERTSTWDLLRRFGQDHLLLFVGDASMSPSELLKAGGGVESANAEPGEAWLKRLTDGFPRHLWINPEPEAVWRQRATVAMIRKIVDGRMVPLTVQGLEQGMRILSH